MSTDPNAPVRLRTGTEVPASTARATYLTLASMVKGDITDVLALCEARALAEDPAHAMWPGTPERLEKLALIDAGGKMHEDVRSVILAAVEGWEDMHVVWPFDGQAA